MRGQTSERMKSIMADNVCMCACVHHGKLNKARSDNLTLAISAVSFASSLTRGCLGVGLFWAYSWMTTRMRFPLLTVAICSPSGLILGGAVAGRGVAVPG